MKRHETIIRIEAKNVVYTFASDVDPIVETVIARTNYGTEIDNTNGEFKIGDEVIVIIGKK